MFSFAPLLIGAGVGALGGLLTGKDPLSGAAMGAAMGGAGSALGSAGAWTGGSASVAGTQGAAGLTSAAMPSLAPQMASSGMGTAASMGSNYMPSYMPEMGMANSFDVASGMPMATQGFEQTMYDNPLLSTSAEQGGMAAPEASMFDSISPYLNIDNLQGASSVYDKFSQEPQRMAQAPAGGMSAGKAPQGADIQALIAGIQPIQRKRISLL
tara:strand:- start:1175 stop:1810 length:636 start_codon:yes stop_codon:yes gene_type:complete